MRIINFILIYFFLSLNSFSGAYVYNKSGDGINIRWPAGKRNLTLNTSPGTSSSGISNSIIQNIIQASANQWNGKSEVNLNLTQSNDSERSNRNDLFFSASSLYFSSTAVVGVTQVVFDQVTKDIVEADIILNNNIGFSDDPASLMYVGNVISHEMGHFFGLTHSQVHGSSMMFKLAKGQYSISSDEAAGVYGYYPNGQSLGSISGQVIGGKSLTGIFGAHVTAISAKEGKVVAATISQVGGAFKIEGLPLDDDYYIYISPLKALETIPSFYADVKDNFCDGAQAFRGSFFQGCSPDDEGYPQGVPLRSSSANQDIGAITIRCGLNVPSDYIIQKTQGQETSLDITSYSGINNSTIHLGETLTGFYTQLQVDHRQEDQFKIDLSHIDLSSYSPLSSGGPLYLEVKVIAQSLYSNIQMEMEIETNSQGTLSFPAAANLLSGVQRDQDNNANIEVAGRASLNLSNPLDNIFTIHLKPQSVQSYLSTISANDVSEESLFTAGNQYFNDDLSFYILMINVSRKSGGNYEVISMKNAGVVVDNTQCPMGNNAFTVAGNKTKTPDALSLRRRSSEQSPFACGTIDLDNDKDNFSGPFNLLIGLMLGHLLFIFRRRRVY